MGTRGAWVASVIALIWSGLVVYAICFYYLLIGSAFGAHPAQIILIGVPPVFLVSGLVVAVIGRRRGHAWAFGTILVLLVCGVGSLIVAAHVRGARNCYEPDGHYCAQSLALRDAALRDLGE